MNKKYSTFRMKNIFTLALLCLCLISISGIGQTSKFEKEVQTLFGRLNTETIQSISKGQSNKSLNINQLLEFYKTREHVKHPISLQSSSEVLSEKELKYANDALEHIFVGQPAYPSYFCGENINWNSRPVPDMEWVWQLNRMYFWNAMGKVYANTKDERFAKEWCTQLIDWVKKNPRDKEHAHAWRSIEAGIRGHNWTGLFYQFRGSKHFTPEVLVAYLNSCYEHAEYLMTQYKSGSNWSLMEAEGMAFIAFTFPEFKNADKWKKEAIRRFSIEINKQVYPDGHQRELAMGYHIGSIRWFYRTYEMAKLNGQERSFPASFVHTIEKMCEIPMKIGLPDGTNAQFGDSWAGEPGQYAPLFQEWAELFGRNDFFYLASKGAKGQAPAQTAYALENSGLYSLRSSWDKDAIAMVLKCGPDGGGHCQPDNGTFSLQAGGRTLMPDGGSYIYSGDPEGRNWFRQTKVHQTLTLNGENTAYAPKLIEWKLGNDLDILVVENESYPNLTHRRSVFFVDKRYFVIVDEAIGEATGDIDIHFQLAPGDAIYDTKAFSARSNFSDGWNILVKSEGQKGLSLSEEEGQVSFIYTKKEPRPAFRYRIEKTNPDQNVRFVTLVAPYEHEIPDIKVELIKPVSMGSELLQIRLTEGGFEKLIKR